MSATVARLCSAARNADLPESFGPIRTVSGRSGTVTSRRQRKFLISTFSSGLPYTPTTIEGIRNAEENAGRKPVHMTSNFQAFKNFAIGGTSLQVTFKIYNLFDRLNEAFVFTNTGRSTYSLRPTFAGDPAEIYPDLVGSGIYSIEERLYSPTSYRPPRQVLLSLGWSF